MPLPSPSHKDAGLVERHLAVALKAAGWSVRPADPPADFLAVKGARRYPVLFRRAQDARRSMIQALLADAILRGKASIRGAFVSEEGIRTPGAFAQRFSRTVKPPKRANPGPRASKRVSRASGVGGEVA